MSKISVIFKDTKFLLFENVSVQVFLRNKIFAHRVITNEVVANQKNTTMQTKRLLYKRNISKNYLLYFLTIYQRIKYLLCLEHPTYLILNILGSVCVFESVERLHEVSVCRTDTC